MEFVAANTGKQIFYIEKDRITAIVENPVIHKVPGTSHKIAGLSFFDGRPVVYFCLEDKLLCRCGVLFDIGEKMLYGITAQEVGSDEIEPACLSAVRTGVWVMRSD